MNNQYHQAQRGASVESRRKFLENLESDSFLYTEPASEVQPWLEIRDLGRLGLTCKFFNEQLSIARAAHYVVVEPRVVEIKKMLDAADPQLLRKLLSKKISKVVARSGIFQILTIKPYHKVGWAI